MALIFFGYLDACESFLTPSNISSSLGFAVNLLNIFFGTPKGRDPSLERAHVPRNARCQKENYVKSTKAVTEAVRNANRQNASASTGPKTNNGKSNSSINAICHGILAKKIVFHTKEQRREYRKLKVRCREHFQPQQFLEAFLVDEITINIWKLQVIEGLEAQELLKRQEGDNDLNGIFSLGNDLELPMDGVDLPLEHGLDCERLTVRGSVRKDSGNSNSGTGPLVVNGQALNGARSSVNSNKDSGSHLEVEAVLVSTLESMGRYKARVKKDLYRAIETLRTIQAERKNNETEEERKK